MTWESAHRPHVGGQPLPAPDDGIVASGNPPGSVGKRWEALIRRAPSESHDRVLRGRNYARRGRARMLHISPGSATAEVVSDALFNPSLRVRPFGRVEWAGITAFLLDDLDTIAALLEGELPPRLLKELQRRDIDLIPRFDELSFDCDCGDYIMPCTHVATVFHILVDALDGDPFLLLTLRGRTPEHLMATLRSAWGDELPIEHDVSEPEEPAPEDDWFSSPRPIPDFACTIEQRAAAAAGLLALGPPPGGEDLIGTLRPLYEAGGAAAERMISEIPAHEARRAAPAPDASVQAPPGRAEPAPVPVEPEPTTPIDLTEVLIDHLADHDGTSTKHIARALDIPVARAGRELEELEELGIVRREGRGHQAVWWLG